MNEKGLEFRSGAKRGASVGVHERRGGARAVQEKLKWTRKKRKGREISLERTQGWRGCS